MAYTHALKLQLGFIPAGFFPIGTPEHLAKLAEDHIKSGASQPDAQLYTLTKEPDFTTAEITGEAIKGKIDQVVSGARDIAFSTKELRMKAAPFSFIANSIAGAAKKTWDDVKTGKIVDAKDLAVVIGGGQMVSKALAGVGNTLSNAVEKAFWNVQTDTYIRNEHGVFVSGAWLDNAENATISKKVPLAQPKAEATTTAVVAVPEAAIK